MATRPARNPLTVKLTSHFLLQHVGREHGGQTGGAGRQSGVGGDAADAFEIHRGKRAARIESVPAEPQQQTAGGGDRQIVRQHRSAAVALEFASEPRSQNNGAGQGDESADGVHDRRAGEVMEAG